MNYTDYNTLYKLIEEQAKYQKIMLIYDDSVSNIELDAIYHKIKELCIYNNCHISADLTEVYNGYRMLIFLCNTDSFLNLKINLDEFVSVFIPTDGEMLPYFLTNQNKLTTKNNFLLLKLGVADAQILPSIYFNTLFNYIQELIFIQANDTNFYFEDFNITQKSLIEMLQNIDKELHFYDIEILKECQLSYKYLPLVDYVLCCAFCCFIKAVKSNSLSLVDIYKLVGDNYDELDRYYAMANSGLVVDIVKLNAHCMISYADKTREKILQNIATFSYEEVNKVINRVKNYAKTTNGLLGYLYLYNIFTL